MFHARIHLAKVTTGSLGKAEAGNESAGAVTGTSPTGDTTGTPQTPGREFALLGNGRWAKAGLAAREERAFRAAHIGGHHDLASGVTVSRTHLSIAVAVFGPLTDLTVDRAANLGVTFLLLVQGRGRGGRAWGAGASSEQILGPGANTSATGGGTLTPR